MKNYAKVGNRKGKPAYRTPSPVRNKFLREANRLIHKKMVVRKRVPRAWGLANRLEHRKVKDKK